MVRELQDVKLILAGTSERYNMVCAPSEDKGQPAHPHSLIRVLAWRSMGSQGLKNSSYRQRRQRSAYTSTQSDQSLGLALYG